MRTYIVIPEGTEVLRVEASTPQYAINKARRGKGERVDAAAAALPASAMIEPDDRPTFIPGQLAMPVERPLPDPCPQGDALGAFMAAEAAASVALDGQTQVVETA